MNLINTIILAEDNQESRDKLTSLHQTDDFLVVVIFRKGPLVEKAVQAADIVAREIIAGISRKVVWMKDIAMLPFLMTLIADGPQFSTRQINADSHIGISLSMDHVLMDIIDRNPEANALRMEIAFINAGKSH